MNFIKNNIWTICLIALFCIFGFAGDAAAMGGKSIMGTATDKAKNVFRSVKTIIFVVGGFVLLVSHGVLFSVKLTGNGLPHWLLV